MTRTELIDLTKKCLVEWEPALKPKLLSATAERATAEPFNDSAVPSETTFHGSMDGFTEQLIRFQISNLFEPLQNTKGDFMMSKPKPQIETGEIQSLVVEHGALNLTFIFSWDGSKLDQRTQIACWYFPVLV
jgi:hypothetical protein